MNKNIIVKDPQDLLNLLLSTGLFINILIFTWLFLLYLSLNIISIFYLEEYYIFITWLVFILYFFLIALCIFIFDLNTFHWEIFYQDKTFDFQPDLLLWYSYYSGELFDLFFYFFIIVSFYCLLLYSPYKCNFIHNKIVRKVPFLFLAGFSFYFLGGESLVRDIWLFILSFILSEMFIFSKICWDIFKRYKTI